MEFGLEDSSEQTEKMTKMEFRMVDRESKKTTRQLTHEIIINGTHTHTRVCTTRNTRSVRYDLVGHHIHG